MSFYSIGACLVVTVALSSVLCLFICFFSLHERLCMKALELVAKGGVAACPSGRHPGLTPAMSAPL